MIGVIVGMAIGTFLLRLSFLGLGERVVLPPWLERGLRYVAPAVLAALVIPALVRPEGALDLAQPRLVAGVVAALVAWRTRSVVATLVVGMVTLWALRWAWG